MLVSFDSLIFLSALTRGGLTTSAHAYALSPAGPVLLLFALVVTIYFIILARKQNRPIFKLVGEWSITKISTVVSILAFTGIFLVCLLGVIYPILQGLFTGSSISTDPAYYTTRTYPFVMLFILSLIGCVSSKIGKRTYIIIITGILAAGIACVAIRYPTDNAMVNFGLPMLFGGFFASVYGLANDLGKTRSLAVAGRRLVHIGVLLLLFGVFISSTTQQTKTYPLTQNSPISGDDTLSIRLVHTQVGKSTSMVYVEELGGVAPEYTEIKVDAQITYRAALYSGTLTARLYVNYGYVAQPLIITTLYGDVYLNIDPSGSTYNNLVSQYTGTTSQPVSLYIVGEQVPLIYLIWVGVALMMLGALLPYIIINRKN